jgi:phage terminase large subunit-like protein
MQAGHSVDLSLDFGRETKNLTGTPEYGRVFPGFTLAPTRGPPAAGAPPKAAATSQPVCQAVSPARASTSASSTTRCRSRTRARKPSRTVFNWYGGGFYTRQALDVSAIVAVGTRWDKGDLFGQLLAKSNGEDEFADDWTVLKIPAVIDAETAELLNEVSRDPLLITDRHPKRYKFKAGDSFAPRRYPLKKILRRKANLSTLDWEALYQQNPTVEEGAILKRSWWRKWPKDKPPRCKYVIQVYDTAFSEEDQKNSAFTARTTWGIFEAGGPQAERRRDHDAADCVILLERYNKRVGFPELRDEALRAYKDYKPDRVLIEKKASGQSLLQELRKFKRAARRGACRHRQGDRALTPRPAFSSTDSCILHGPRLVRGCDRTMRGVSDGRVFGSRRHLHDGVAVLAAALSLTDGDRGRRGESGRRFDSATSVRLSATCCR